MLVKRERRQNPDKYEIRITVSAKLVAETDQEKERIVKLWDALEDGEVEPLELLAFLKEHPNYTPPPSIKFQ